MMTFEDYLSHDDSSDSRYEWVDRALVEIWKFRPNCRADFQSTRLDQSPEISNNNLDGMAEIGKELA